MFSKISISGKIELLTGMHIGTGGEFAPIGAIDSPVIRDNLTQLPIIPGSTLKGKMRSILAKKYSISQANFADDDCEEIKRLFGSMSKQSKVIFSDMYISNMDELAEFNIYTPTEAKFENTIQRLSGVANPRQIERVIRGCKFDMELIYDYEDEKTGKEDIAMLAEAMKLLEYDYIGGHGTRGYGKIKFNDLKADVVTGNIDDSIIKEINDMLKEVN